MTGIGGPDVEAIIRGDHRDPFAYLGMHQLGDELVVRAFLPDAAAVEVREQPGGTVVGTLRRVHEAGLFEGRLGKRPRFRYTLGVRWGDQTVEIDDAYQFLPTLTESELQLLTAGVEIRGWTKYGARVIEIGGTRGVHFAVWAPNARRVSVVGDFNTWDGRRHVMRLHASHGVWEIFIPGLDAGTIYKYEIQGRSGMMLPLKADPFGQQAEVPPRTASVVPSPEPFHWTDGDWYEALRQRDPYRSPISIYEVHLGSWRRHPDNRYYTYDEIADALIPYLVDLGFTHVEMLPITEYPFDGSWGYQPVGLFAATSRYGTPDDFRRFVDRCHAAGIGVLLDWVPGHFPTDAHGLAQFDGTHLYEHADPRQGRHMDWGTLIFNYGRNEVRSYLLSSALFWLEACHVDGLRVDAVASMLYLDYSRSEGEWIPNVHGGRENLEAVDFLRRLNETVYYHHPHAMMIAEESTAWPMVSRPTSAGGLGFGFKWNMGWMHDTLDYMGRDPIHRNWHHEQLTFGLLYAFTENFVLPLSHDEVVHGKGSIYGRMPGDEWQKFANVRAYYAFMWGHPGKKLLFMGGEFAQEREWSHDRELDWFLLGRPGNAGVQRLVRDLNRLLKEIPALHEVDHEGTGFQWIEGGDRGNSVICFARHARDQKDALVVVVNFTPEVRQGYRIGLPSGGTWQEVLNTDSHFYGGSDVGNAGLLQAEPMGWHGQDHSLSLTLPPLAALYLRPTA